MRSLNDDELNSLLRQAKASPPKPSPEFAARVTRAYERQSGRSSVWHRLLFGTVRMPIPIGVVASIVLILVGAEFGRKLGQTRSVEAPTVQERAATSVDRDRPVLNLYGLQPVTELHPRIIRRVHEDR